MDHDPTSKRPTNPEFGKRLKERRTELGLSQLDLAKRVGTSQGAIARYENRGKIPWQYETLKRLAQALDTTIEFLVHGDHGGKTAQITEPSPLSLLPPQSLRALLELLQPDRQAHLLTKFSRAHRERYRQRVRKIQERVKKETRVEKNKRKSEDKRKWKGKVKK